MAQIIDFSTSTPIDVPPSGGGGNSGGSGGTGGTVQEQVTYVHIPVDIPVHHLPTHFPIPRVYVRTSYGVEGDMGYGLTPYGGEAVTPLTHVKFDFPNDFNVNVFVEPIYEEAYTLKKINDKYFELNAPSGAQLIVLFN